MNYEIIAGDALQTLKTLPANSVQTCVTSPPYYGLRDYGTATWEGGDAACDHVAGMDKPRSSRPLGAFHGGDDKFHATPFKDVCGKCGARRIDSQVGLEETPELFVAKLVDVFREVRRVLRDDATLWLNLGDSFRNKQLLGIPWRVAFALQADGWFLRMDCIWHKPSTMPESVTDRPTKAHEYIFLLSKSASYYYDADAIREPVSQSSLERWGDDPYTKRRPNGLPTHAMIGGETTCGTNPNGRNRRSVWTVTTKPYKGSHFAVFPEALIEPCILAGSSAYGACSKCGAPWARVVETPKYPTELRARPGDAGVKVGYGHPTVNTTGSGQKMQDWRDAHPPVTTGWQPSCTCNADVVPCVVLDPFNGSGTTGAVALKHNRHYIGLELNPDYIELSHKRIGQAQPLLLLEGAL